MATTTALVIVVEAHPHCGGLSRTHLIEFLEGETAACVLYELAH